MQLRGNTVTNTLRFTDDGTSIEGAGDFLAFNELSTETVEFSSFELFSDTDTTSSVASTEEGIQ